MDHVQIGNHSETRQQPGRLRRWGALTLLGVWAVSLSLIIAALMVGHWVSLPTPAAGDPVLERQLADLTREASPGQWRMVHVLYSRCRCSQRIFDYLFDSSRPLDTDETVLLVGPHREYERRARAAGFRVEQVAQEELGERFAVQSAPLLLIVSPEGHLRYSGGHTARKQGLDYRDRALLARLRGSEDVSALPLFGCAVSRQLQAYLDPIGLKYGGWF